MRVIPAQEVNCFFFFFFSSRIIIYFQLQLLGFSIEAIYFPVQRAALAIPKVERLHVLLTKCVLSFRSVSRGFEFWIVRTIDFVPRVPGNFSRGRFLIKFRHGTHLFHRSWDSIGGKNITFCGLVGEIVLSMKKKKALKIGYVVDVLLESLFWYRRSFYECQEFRV